VDGDDSITEGFLDSCGGDEDDKGGGVDFDDKKSFGDGEPAIIDEKELRSVACGGLVVDVNDGKGAVAADIATANP
jgi:hypothetical protein